MADDPVLLAERHHLEKARQCLSGMRRDTEQIADFGVDALASESLGALRAKRLRALDADPDAPAFFGRTDRDNAEIFHIGRRHIRDDAGDPVVIDWRAPIARAFYRASPVERMGVRRRRRFGFQHGQITSFEDERLDAGEQLGLASDLLRQEIERPRVGPMRDIVATIQPDQDDLVRADLDVSLCIQGAPGTGKTAVGLHRAAYLLYTFPDRLRRSGVLVIGPNSAFLDYIAQVLPALGEGGIQQATVDDLVAHVRISGTDRTEVAVLKGDARMAAVLERAVRSHIRRPSGDVLAMVGTRRFRIGEHRLRRYVDDTRRAGLRWDAARDRLRQQLAEDVRRQREDVGGAPSDADTAKVARSPAVKEFLDAVWPALKAPTLLARLYSDPGFLASCADGTLTDDEQALLHRTGPRWTAADTVLIDEIAGLLEPVPGYVHAVVDEAQDLSAMQCRAVARRCPLGSITVLGDLAQATTAWAPGTWEATLGHLGHEATVRPLTAGYRVPGEVLDVANRLLPHIAPELAPATSVRAGEHALRYSTDLDTAIRECLAAEGSIGLIVPDATAIPSVPDDPRISVVPAAQAKGLEFDSVILVEPARIVAAEPTRLAGLRRLYVVLTRAVSRLVIVHQEPLPPELN